MYVVNTDFKRPGKDLIERAADTFACIAGQAAGRRSVMDSGIRPLSRGWRFAGPAFTVFSENPLDTLISRVALKYAKPGDVLVVDAGGRTEAAAWGATMAWAAKEVGIVGIVIDGVVLTTELLIDREGMPIFCRGSTTGHVGGDGPGSINEPVICGRVIVKPGDIIIADEDGVVSLPLERAKALLDKAGQGRSKPFPPESRKVPFNSRGHEDKLRKLPDIEWK